MKVMAMNAFSNVSLDIGFINVLANSSHKEGNCINLTVLVLTMSFCNQSTSWSVYGLHLVISSFPATVLKFLRTLLPDDSRFPGFEVLIN